MYTLGKPFKGSLKFQIGQEEMYDFLLKVFMRALFCYNPKEDRAIPCQEAGLPFKRRHVLEVVSQDDPTWWQAKRVGDTNLRAGLIPSKQFQERFVNGDFGCFFHACNVTWISYCFFHGGITPG